MVHSIKIHPIEGQLSEKTTTELLHLVEQLFSDISLEKTRQRLQAVSNIFTLIAYDENQKAIGCKIGFEESSTVFYSWLGGVLPEYRRLGLAQKMMEQQHEWAKQQGYLHVRTKTLNKWKNMLLLNIQSGFEIVDLEMRATDGPKIILEKRL